MAVGLPGQANLEASIFFTVFKVYFCTGSENNGMLNCIFRASISKDLTSGLQCHVSCEKHHSSSEFTVTAKML